MSKFLIAGLGNIGSEYENTRHNIGFTVLDSIANTAGINFRSDRLAHVAEYKFKGKTFILIKPTTFMNLSGKAVNYWLQAEKIHVSNLLVVTDDIALPFGTLRMKGKGSDGGHNGLKDIQAVLNTTEYARLRFGVGNNYPKGQQADYVLSKWTIEEQTGVNGPKLNDRVVLAIEMIKSFGAIGLERTMSAYNNK